MARRELHISKTKEDNFVNRSWILKAEGDTALLEPDWLIRKMRECHSDVSRKTPKLKMRISGPIRECLELAKKIKISTPHVKMRFMKNVVDKKAEKAIFVNDSIRIYLDFK